MRALPSGLMYRIGLVALELAVPLIRAQRALAAAAILALPAALMVRFGLPAAVWFAVAPPEDPSN